MDAKPWYLSKTIVGAILTSLAGILAYIVPGAGAWLSAHVADVLTGLGIGFGVLRVITKKPLDFS